MATTLRLSRYDPEPVVTPARWQVGYVVDRGIEDPLYAVVTVYAADLPNTDEATVRAAAEAAILADVAARAL